MNISYLNPVQSLKEYRITRKALREAVPELVKEENKDSIRLIVNLYSYAVALGVITILVANLVVGPSEGIPIVETRIDADGGNIGITFYPEYFNYEAINGLDRNTSILLWEDAGVNVQWCSGTTIAESVVIHVSGLQCTSP